MDGGRFDEGERVVEDEFTCAGMLRGSLTSLHATVERIFRVHFAIGTDQPSHSNDGQIWLKLRGLKSDVQAAKLFVKGVVNQEEQQEVPYPPTLHCVFCGARGLFMDCLIRTTSALIVVGSPGCLLLSGLMEPVVRAFSLITDLVERSEATQAKRTEPGERCPGESVESRRAFKNLVEQWDDRHTLDLLVLPGSIKEILLELIKEARLGDNPGQLLTDAKQVDPWEKSVLSFEESDTKWEASFSRDSLSNFLDSFDESESVRGRPEGAEGNSKSPQELSEEEQLDTNNKDKEEGEESIMQLSGRKEFWLLLKFFTAMGYTEDVVKRVLAKTGLPEPSQILDLVQQEQDRTDKELRAKDAERNQDGGAVKGTEQNRPCETEHEEENLKRQTILTKRRENIDDGKVNEATGGVGELRDDDFVFGVVKKAAAICGYNEKQVTEAYSMHPDRSMHDLLLELQRSESKHSGYLKEGPREMDDVVVEKEPPKVTKERFNNKHVEATENRDINDRKDVLPKRNGGEEEVFRGDVNQKEQTNQGRGSGPKPQNGSVDIRGPPMSSYATNNRTQFLNPATNQPNNYTSARPQSPRTQKQGFEQTNRNDWSPTRTNERKGPHGAVVVTGEQRFLEGLNSHFELRLTDRPGKANLRNIIIDGSNVAMSHGLGHFFSCRGIALAVQHFWDRGHRQISALVPQWRTKTDPRNKEQHYLTTLKELGIVSFTPSREVQGKRISSYDDRLMLQLAQKTDGVIVTNDNLRDLSIESHVWTDIIKKRLLQYTFVGDLFMVPDDPLGRGGPHLDEFLSTEHRFPDPDSHIFNNTPASFPSSQLPHGQTDLMNYRDRPPRGAWEPQGAARRGKDPTTATTAGLGQDWTRPEAAVRPERSPEETQRLMHQLCQVFPGKENLVTLLLQSYPTETDINTLSAQLLEES